MKSGILDILRSSTDGQEVLRHLLGHNSPDSLRFDISDRLYSAKHFFDIYSLRERLPGGHSVIGTSEAVAALGRLNPSEMVQLIVIKSPNGTAAVFASGDQQTYHAAVFWETSERAEETLG